jgi:hypothetical protein
VQNESKVAHSVTSANPVFVMTESCVDVILKLVMVIALQENTVKLIKNVMKKRMEGQMRNC